MSPLSFLVGTDRTGALWVSVGSRIDTPLSGGVSWNRETTLGCGTGGDCILVGPVLQICKISLTLFKKNLLEISQVGVVPSQLWHHSSSVRQNDRPNVVVMVNISSICEKCRQRNHLSNFKASALTALAASSDSKPNSYFSSSTRRYRTETS